MRQWDNYFIANAGAAAALTGLIFVAVSLNLQRILSIKHLPNRALGSMALLANILIVCSLCLVPGQPAALLSAEVLALGAIIWVTFTKMDIAAYRQTVPEYKRHALQNLIFTQIAIIPYLACGIALLFFTPDTCFYWLIPGVTFSFIKSLTDAWVLLVEINR